MADNNQKILVIQAARGPDYLADMISHYLYNTASLRRLISTNKHPLYLFDDFPRATPLYGKGFTVYRKIPADQKSRISLHDDPKSVSEAIAQMQYDIIVWTSIRRCSSHLSQAIQSGYDKEKLIVVDGEDDASILDMNGKPLSDWARLYKRELLVDDENRGVMPISFKFPSEHPVIHSTPKRKTQILAGCDPRFKSSYVYDTEESYYANYQSSLFAYTTQKAGWDCCRHYEILACNCMPIFPDFMHLPASTMKEWSRVLQLEANNLWGVFSTVHAGSIDPYHRQWESLNERFQKAFREHMLTDSYQSTLGF